MAVCTPEELAKRKSWALSIHTMEALHETPLRYDRGAFEDVRRSCREVRTGVTAYPWE